MKIPANPATCSGGRLPGAARDQAAAVNKASVQVFSRDMHRPFVGLILHRRDAKTRRLSCRYVLTKARISEYWSHSVEYNKKIIFLYRRASVILLHRYLSFIKWLFHSISQPSWI